MAFSNHLFFFFFLLLLSLASFIHGADFIAKECGSNITNNDALQANINSIILDLVTKTSSAGFGNSTYGSGYDTVYGTAECRGDITGQDCTACIIAAGQEIRTTCANANESHIWYQQCSFRYSTTNFLGQADTTLLGVWRSAVATKDPQGFKKILKEFFSVLTVAASTSGENRKFVWGEMESRSKLTNGEEVTTVYGMAHCTWDLDESTCAACLGAAFNIIKEEREGAYIILKSCEIRHESMPFLFVNAAPSPTANIRNITYSNI
ncbi:cysteine-rich repeat secretory protein 55-like [Phalaenopsis equestris]|uniref:cysteine-rich repeat secretory protein 55-like n=1 Tax=Phalaenopsis equestris TaxID=78828 RepID=UPI0009E2F190|nr:cysteine-rich repeat secretory protein 55-like [Phalaenopsis equestris]